MTALWGAFVIGMAAMGAYLYLAMREPTPWIALLALLALTCGCLAYLLHSSGFGRRRR